MNVVKEIEKTDDFNKLEEVGLILSKKMYSLKAKCIPTPKLSLG